MRRPQNLEAVAFWPVTHLAQLVHTRQVTSVELTTMYLGRLKRFNGQLNCVAALTEERALAEAKVADAEIASGTYRGTLHGLPYGVKDIIAAKGYPTRWGAPPLERQTFDERSVAATLPMNETARSLCCSKYVFKNARAPAYSYFHCAAHNRASISGLCHESDTLPCSGNRDETTGCIIGA